MPNSNVLKIARVLNILVSITFICNLLALLLVPTLVRQAYVSPYLYQELLWDQTLVWKDPQAVALIFFFMVFRYLHRCHSLAGTPRIAHDPPRCPIFSGKCDFSPAGCCQLFCYFHRSPCAAGI